jgi:hypothetical protein
LVVTTKDAVVHVFHGRGTGQGTQHIQGTPYDSGTGDGNVLGAAAVSLTDRFETPRPLRWSLRRYAGALAWGPGELREGDAARVPDFRELLRWEGMRVGSTLAPEINLQPLTGAWSFRGTQRTHSLSHPVGHGLRHRIESRWGVITDPTEAVPSRREGFDMSTGNGVIVDLAIPLARALPAPGNIRVYGLVKRLKTADQVSGDPMTAAPDAGWHLPQLQRGTGPEGYVDILLQRHEWFEVPLHTGADLATATGEVFVLDAASRRIRIATDREATFQAYSLP